jgi:hypothetical protein
MKSITLRYTSGEAARLSIGREGFDLGLATNIRAVVDPTGAAIAVLDSHPVISRHWRGRTDCQFRA